MELITRAAPQLAKIREVGVALIWGDVGAAPTCLRHITRVDVDGLTIGRSFVRDMHTVPAAMTVVQMLVHLAEGLGIAVTARGVETDAQLVTLKGLGATCAQGPYIGTPSPLAQP